ncbi:DUF1508 domain-containing protein [Salinimicrobium sp. GXAS 041]|uniref:DUF1508 domain-containing protein n=1 Tax=Salinimicrobium sp. GXAS 041 TaxID=3400806 RepID=UPI003C76609F
MSAFVISKRPGGDYKFTFASRKGKTIFTSIACKQKSDCEVMINAIQEDTTNFTFSKKRTGGGKYFFRISRNGLVLATSRKFTTELMLQKGIDQILKYVPVAETLDFSESEDIFAEADSPAEVQM